MITSKLTSKAQTVDGLRAGDEIAYSIEAGRVILTRAAGAPADDPFRTFAEWDSEADRKGYADLRSVGCREAAVPVQGSAGSPAAAGSGRGGRPPAGTARPALGGDDYRRAEPRLAVGCRRERRCGGRTAGRVIDARDAEPLGALPMPDRAAVSAELRRLMSTALGNG